MSSAVGRFYKITDAARSWTTQGDLGYLKPAADKICKMEFVIVSASGGTADAGDAQEELYDIEVIRLNATVTAPSGGAAFTPIKQLVNDAAAGATARVGDSTKGSATTSEVMHADGMNNRQPFLWYPKDDQEEWIANAAALVVRLNTTPADAILLSLTIGFRELP